MTTSTPESVSMTTAAVAPTSPTADLNYFQTLRPVQAGRWWRSLVALVSIGFGYLALSAALSMAAVVIEIVTGQRAGFGTAAGGFTITPLLMLATNLTAAALIPMAILLDRLLYGRSGTLHSVRRRLRRGWLLRSALILVPLFGVYAVLGGWLMPSPGGSTDQLIWWLLIVLLTTPLQAAGEEYGFRGFVGRVVGSWFGTARLAVGFGTALSAIVFMIAHGSLDPWLLSYYLVFGAVLSLVTWRTGGLEAAIVIHVANNVTMLVVGLLTSDVAAGFDRSVGVGGPFMLVPMLVIALLGLLITVVASRFRIARRTAPGLPVTAAAGQTAGQ